MSKVKTLEKEVEKLSRSELTAFREWFAEFDARVWDRQISKDVMAGKLDALGEKAIAAHKRGESREL